MPFKLTSLSLSLLYFSTVILTIIIGQAYLFFREKTSTNVLNNFPANSGIINACRLLFAIDMCATYPLEAFVARDTIEASFFKGKPGNDFRRIIISVFLVVATTSIGMFVCSLGIIYDLTGGVAASMIAFIFPSACWLKIHRMDPSLEKLSRSSVILHLSSIVFGFVILIMSLITSSTSQKLSTSCSW